MGNISRGLELLFWVSFFLSLSCLSLGFDPVDNYLLNCGSSANKSVGHRTFVGDGYRSSLLSTQNSISANTTTNPPSSSNHPALYQTAKIFFEISQYKFQIRQHGSHWIRLHFFESVYRNYNMSLAEFSVSAQNFTLIKELQLPGGGVAVKEFCLNISSDELVLTFNPSTGSFAFINALEVFSLPDDLIPEEANKIGPQGGNKTLSEEALETVARVNMGNFPVASLNDTLWRSWVSDYSYLVNGNSGTFVSNFTAVNFAGGSQMEDIAPVSVYGSATTLISEDPRTIANLTWKFGVDPGFQHLVRLHFCDIVSNSTFNLISFKVYIDSHFVRHLDLSALTSNVRGVPYFLDVVTIASASRLLNVSVGISSSGVDYPIAILNGLEIMKISNSKGSLDVLDAVLSKRSKLKVAVIVGAAVAVCVLAAVSVVALFLVCRRRNNRSGIEKGGKLYDGTSIVSSIGYQFPFAVIQEATSNFSESLVIGVGGFGKVYKGVLRDETHVAVKRGGVQSNQGLAEFRTEIEMLSQFRHRHLVSLIGYCDERNEMIIVYEYMEKGSLKSHLYGSNLPVLSWRQRVDICIGAARGLHYLHTGTTKAIIHRDVKSANILLDENFMAKVADFGISKTCPEIDETHISTAVKGSFGYLDPEYLTRQQLTEKSDVYSFGVVMFEVLCGRAVIEPTLPREQVSLVEWAMKFQKSGKLEEIIDPKLAEQVNPESLKKFGETAEKCLAGCGTNRPSMGDVLWNLEAALQIQERNSHHNKEIASEASNMDSSVSGLDISMGSAADIAGFSMTKLFAQMVRQDMR